MQQRDLVIRWYAVFILASAVSCLWVAYRVKVSETGFYTFMIWNLFLAWVPLWAATACLWCIDNSRFRSHARRMAGAVMGLIWLVFLPNAPYVVTDLIHFSYVRGDGLWPWSDLFMLVLFAWISLLLGYCSLYLLHDYMRRRYGRLSGWCFAIAALLLQAAGVFVGRELRWNSWWVLTEPARLLADLPSFLQLETYRFIGMAALFCGVGYIMIYSFLCSSRHGVNLEREAEA
jgi:uncharacterized membrane protein